MSAFSSLSEFWQTMLPFIMLVEIVLEIGLFMYQLLRSNKPVRSLLSLAVMAVMIPLLFSVSQADPDNIGDAFLLDAPWLNICRCHFPCGSSLCHCSAAGIPP